MAETTESHLPETFIQKRFSQAYIRHEKDLLWLSTQPGQPREIDQARRDLAKNLSEVTEQDFFEFVPDENRRRSMRETALNAARNFWTEKLEDPNLPANTVTLGQSRIAEISQRLEELAKPPENPA